MSFASREYEQAVKYGNYQYQWDILSIEIRRLRERQRTIERAEKRAEKAGIDRIIVDVATQAEFQQNKKDIETLSKLREETQRQVRAQKKGGEIPKAQTYKGLRVFQRQSAKIEREKQEFPKASQRTLTARIQRGMNEAVEETIDRMFFKGNFLKSNYNKLAELTSKYRWVFDIKGFSLTDNFKSFVARNYSDFGSDIAFDYFNEVVEEELSDEPTTNEKDGKIYVDETHTLQEYRKAIAEIVKALKTR